MEFIHQHYQPGETIAAIATALGEGGVAIIRISGNLALDVAERIFTGPVRSFATHTVHYGHIKDAKGQIVDDVLLIPMLGKRSYTGEDTIEIHCHGGSIVTRRVLDVALQAGARQASPGEFTFKAFINGKLDLAQAEAVQELIAAKNERAMEAATDQLQGRLSVKVAEYQDRLTQVAAILEAWVDFPDEGLEFASMEDTLTDLRGISSDLQQLLLTYHDGKVIHDGISLCLTGCPNVGKSSLMNALLDKERAIVSHIPGTTRDIIEDALRLNGLNFRLIDTAGIRVTDEVIEQEGIRRSKEALGKADLILLLLDATQGLKSEDALLLDLAPKAKTIVVWNKIDLPHPSLPPLNFPHVIQMSAKTRQGLKELHEMIDQVIWDKGPPSKEEILITNVRHKEALENAQISLEKVIDGLLENVSAEFVTSDMRQCLKELGKVIGTNISEDVLNAIFSKFCIGK